MIRHTSKALFFPALQVECGEGIGSRDDLRPTRMGGDEKTFIKQCGNDRRGTM